MIGRDVVNNRTVGFYSRKLQVCSGDFSGNDIGEDAVHLRGDRGAIPRLLAKIIKPKGHRQVICGIGKTGVQVLTAQVLNDPEVPIAVILRWLDDRSFAEVIPGDNLNDS